MPAPPASAAAGTSRGLAPSIAEATQTPTRTAKVKPDTSHVDNLYVESAQLEALLAELSGIESGNGTQLVLASTLRDRVAGIDEALSSSLDDQIRSRLWQQRVDALRELVALAAEQRRDALYGTRGDYAMVQVY